MKKLTYILLIICSVLSAQSEKVSVNISKGRRGFCTGMGMGCNVDVLSSQSSDKVTLSKYMIQGLNERVILLEINTTHLNKEEERSIAGKELSLYAKDEPIYMAIEEMMVLDKEILKRLNILPKYNIIDKGKYPMQKKGNVLTVVIQLVEQ